MIAQAQEIGIMYCPRSSQPRTFWHGRCDSDASHLKRQVYLIAIPLEPESFGVDTAYYYHEKRLYHESNRILKNVLSSYLKRIVDTSFFEIIWNSKFIWELLERLHCSFVRSHKFFGFNLARFPLIT